MNQFVIVLFMICSQHSVGELPKCTTQFNTTKKIRVANIKEFEDFKYLKCQRVETTFTDHGRIDNYIGCENQPYTGCNVTYNNERENSAFSCTHMGIQ